MTTEDSRVGFVVDRFKHGPRASDGLVNDIIATWVWYKTWVGLGGIVLALFIASVDPVPLFTPRLWAFLVGWGFALALAEI